MLEIAKIQVTQQDILNGKRGSDHKCPVVLAVKRKFMDAFSVHLSNYEDCQSIGSIWHLTIHSFKCYLSFNLPKEVSKIINDFDRTGKMEPFEFAITI